MAVTGDKVMTNELEKQFFDIYGIVKVERK